MSAAQRTPGPWKMSGRVDMISGADDTEVCTLALYGYHLPPVAKANAEFIITACNAHDDLVAALKFLADQCSDLALVAIADAALAKAKA